MSSTLILNCVETESGAQLPIRPLETDSLLPFVEDDRLSAVIHLVGQQVWDGIVIHDLLERGRLGQGVAVLLADEVQRLLDGERRLSLDVSYNDRIRVLAKSPHPLSPLSLSA